MQTRHRRGNTDANNGITLDAGYLSIDEEKKAIRLHDGETLGGYEIVGTRAYEPPLPGPQVLEAGDTESGFYGEVTGNELISGSDLTTQLGISFGDELNADPDWLKFAYQGQILFIAKRPLRHSFSWSQLTGDDLIYGAEGDAQLTIDEVTYRVRLMTGGNGDPSDGAGGEWNALFYPIHVDDPNGQSWGVGYADTDLGIASGDGRTTFCQETSAVDSDDRVWRGWDSLEDYGSSVYNGTNNSFGWRPVLEPIGAFSTLQPPTQSYYETDYVQRNYILDWTYTD